MEANQMAIKWQLEPGRTGRGQSVLPSVGEPHFGVPLICVNQQDCCCRSRQCFSYPCGAQLPREEVCHICACTNPVNVLSSSGCSLGQSDSADSQNSRDQ